MNNRIRLQAIALLLIFTASLTSCDKDDDDNKPASPVIKLEEVGYENKGITHAGSDLHLEAKITADGIIKQIEVEIHQEKGGNHKITKIYANDKYTGTKNSVFHEHIDIPAKTPTGGYHLHLTVTDQAGQSTTAGAEITIEPASDKDHGHAHTH